MFLAPLVTGIGAANSLPVLSQTLLALTAFGFFLLRFPLVLAIKARTSDQRTHALRWSAVYAALTATFGIALVLSAQFVALGALGALGGITLIVYLALAARRAEMTVAGEWIGIAGLCLGAPAAYLVGNGTLGATAAALYALNVLYFGGTVLYIKFKVREQPRVAAKTFGQKLWAGRVTLAYHATVIALVFVCTLMNWIPGLIFFAFILPMCKAFGGVLTRPARLNIRNLGFIELGLTLAFLVIVIAAYR